MLLIHFMNGFQICDKVVCTAAGPMQLPEQSLLLLYTSETLIAKNAINQWSRDAEIVKIL